MIHYLFLPMLLLLLVIAQITILELFSFGGIGIEISLIVVIYLGFHLDALRGGILCLLLGFFMDCLTSAIFGLYMFLYVLIFYISNIAGGRIYAGRPALIASFTALCTLLEGIVIVLFYRFVFGADILDAIPKIFVPQAVVVGCMSPLFFILLKHFEVFLHAEDWRQARRI
jgi:rod shape-determining protein MreD